MSNHTCIHNMDYMNFALIYEYVEEIKWIFLLVSCRLSLTIIANLILTWFDILPIKNKIKVYETRHSEECECVMTGCKRSISWGSPIFHQKFFFLIQCVQTGMLPFRNYNILTIWSGKIWDFINTNLGPSQIEACACVWFHIKDHI